jgi:WD40 repeat protein
VRLWAPMDGAQWLEPLVGVGSINDMCVIDDGRPQLAAANEDRFVQLWDVDAGTPALEMTDHFDAVNAVCALRTDEGLIMASAGDDVTVRLWNPHNGAIRGGLIGHGNWVTALAVVDRIGREALASGDKSGTVRLWDSSGDQIWDQPSHHDAINALCALTVEGRTVLVTASSDRHIGLWSCEDGRRLMVLSGHTAPVMGVCAVPVRGRELLASTSLDRTVRLWDPLTARAVLTIPVHHQALACCYVHDTLMIGLDQGLLALAIRG